MVSGVVASRVISDENLQHAQPWKGHDVRGWFACEKMDGCRGYWDGSRMWSRSGRVIQIPREWASALPRMHLDGEFFAGRGQWETTVAAVVRNKWAPTVCFMVFDAPEIAGCWSKRIAAARKKLRCDFAAVVPHETVRDLVHVSLMFRRVREQGGEGLILRKPEADYSTQRTGDVLKVKACPITGELRWQERRRHVA
jgi:DNA ligase 1